MLMDLMHSTAFWSIIALSAIMVIIFISVRQCKAQKRKFSVLEDRIASQQDAINELRPFKHFIEHAPFPIWQRNEDGALQYANAAYHTLAHAPSSQDDSHKASLPVLHPSNDYIAQKALQTQITQTERKYIIVDGKRHLFSFSECPQYRDDQPQGTFGFATDLQEIDDKERLLKQHLNVQSDLMESSSSAIAIFSADKRLRFYNNAFVRFWELDESFLEQEPDYGAILDKLRDTRKLPEQANFQAFKKESIAMFTNLLEKIEDFFYLPNGKILRQVVIPHDHGGLLMSYEDLTEQIAQQQNYTSLVNVNQTTVDNLYEGVVVFGEDGRMQLCNPSYLNLWKLDERLLDHQPHILDIFDLTFKLYDFIDNGDLYKDNLMNAITNRQSLHQKIERRDGKVIDFSSVPLPNGATLMTYIDITDSALVEKSLRAEKKALEEADLIKGRFLSSISYELRSPLTSIHGFAEGMLRGHIGGATDKQLPYLQAIYDSSVNLTNLIDNILDVASIDSGYMTLSLEDFDIQHLVRTIEESIEKDVSQKDCNLIIDCENDIGTMNGDQKRIEQVMRNLLSNAIRFSRQHDTISFTVKTRGAAKRIICFEVEGYGTPLTKEEKARVFDRFYKPPTDLSFNNGLGLTLAKSFIELHGGKIMIENKSKNRIRVTCTLKRNRKLLKSKNAA